ncbi:hypothetical protein [Nocardia sp. NPDC051832]|uniref:hypothetical protein n=1 Tax=Nocardia sp. NPDC051832 TaxID=3155673 RepID=UPI0034305494
MAIHMGPLETQTDPELLQHLAFWRRKLQEYIRTGDPGSVTEGHEQVRKFRSEAIKRGLIPPTNLDF